MNNISVWLLTICWHNFRSIRSFVQYLTCWANIFIRLLQLNAPSDYYQLPSNDHWSKCSQALRSVCGVIWQHSAMIFCKLCWVSKSLFFKWLHKMDFNALIRNFPWCILLKSQLVLSEDYNTFCYKYTRTQWSWSQLWYNRIWIFGKSRRFEHKTCFWQHKWRNICIIRLKKGKILRETHELSEVRERWT